MPWMLTLDLTMLFFYSHLISNTNQEPPSRKKKANHQTISTWINNVDDNAPLPSRAATLRTGSLPKHLPPLMSSSTCSSSNSVLTNTIQISQNTQPTTTDKECKKPYIRVEDEGIFSDYEKMTSQEQDIALTLPLKKWCAHYQLSKYFLKYFYILILLPFTRTWSPKTS